MPSDAGDGPPRVLFVCVENACRSQMAEAFARHLAGSRLEVASAGSDPAREVNPRTEAFLRERGLSLEGATPTSVDDLPPIRYDVVISMGCGDACPTVASDLRIEWDLTDPAELSDDDFREVRDEIASRVEGLVRSLQR